jgi:3-mercaptopyruvate sulfurtransferase SseA
MVLVRPPVGLSGYAVALKRIGVDKVWVLEGGLKAWREQGFPVSKSLEVPEVVAERLGVKLPKP